MPGQLLVQIRVVGAQELGNRPVLTHLALEEQLRLAHHGLAQRIVETGKQGPVGILPVDVAHLQPLPDEIVHEPRRTPVFQHPLHGTAQGSRTVDWIVTVLD